MADLKNKYKVGTEVSYKMNGETETITGKVREGMGPNDTQIVVINTMEGHKHEGFGQTLNIPDEAAESIERTKYI